MGLKLLWLVVVVAACLGIGRLLVEVVFVLSPTDDKAFKEFLRKWIALLYGILLFAIATLWGLTPLYKGILRR